MNSPLNLYSALEITKYFQRHSLSLSFFFLSSCLGEFSFDSVHSHSFWQIVLPPHPPNPTHALPLSQRPRLPSGSLIPWLVLSLLSPPGYNHRLFIYSLYHSLHQEQVSPERCSEDAVDGPTGWPTYSCTCVAYEIPSSIRISDSFSLMVCISIYSLSLTKSFAYEESVI